MSKLSLKKYGAAWCGPCRMLAPVIENIAKAFPDVEVADIDIDSPPDDELKTVSTIRAVPVIVISRDGKELKRFVGFQTEAALKKTLNELL
jgi:thioredoxin 1